MSSERPYYHKFAWAYDLLQTDPVARRVDFIEAVLGKQGIGAGSSVLDAGCGTGRYALELARRGYRVCGADRSPELIAIARNRAPYEPAYPEFIIADLLAVTFTRAFDAILCRGVLNDLVEEADRIAIFQQFGTWLRSGGIAIFDVREWVRTVARYRKNPVHRRTVELPGETLRFQSETVLDSESRKMRVRECFRVTRDGTETSSENDFVMKCWTPEEIMERLLTTGFDDVGTYLRYGESARAWSDRLVVLARKQST
jgi:SAM-dependent methyltransferase